MDIDHQRPAPDEGPHLPLSVALREGSADEHRRAEGSAFVGDLLAGRATANQYAGYLQRLRVVYAALEAALRAHRAHPAVAAVYDEDLARTEALDLDLDHWAPGDRPAASPAAVAYRDRIETAAAVPELLVAHHYTRYLGDLSGGRMLAHALRAARDGDDVGLAFYDFPAVPKPVPYKRDYRDRLDALPLTGAQRRALVEEVRLAFRLNRGLLDEVASPAPA
ncbi:heme oxygenase (biliverdin-producing) [Nocardioides panaciterrulae]|uniref:heme oxygenase (biliverdin-producing) n=1 Tax=Nocardioides panaciterrulae TaxID=661492 RepID=A0A7Y9JCS5_9ACTN|nr:biliverdin-producing heme oxygenase [Nocardioides panaciterrulae]NYD43581.1 heme oxygenase [Nocardioides panaciterrulae]